MTIVEFTRYGRRADPSRYDEYRDLERAYNEKRADDHEPWCHWNCRGCYTCSACPVADGWHEFWEDYISERTLPQRWVLGVEGVQKLLRQWTTPAGMP